MAKAKRGESHYGSKKGRKKDYRTLEVKTSIIREMKAGASIKFLHEKYNISNATLYDWRRDMAKIEKDASVVANPDISKFYKSRFYNLVEEGLNIWIQYQCKHRAPLSCGLLQNKAKEIYDNLPLHCLEDRSLFNASMGWISNFLQRNGYHLGMMHGKTTSVDVVSSDLFKEKFSDLVKDYDPRQIFTADETTLFWRYFPKTKLMVDGEEIQDSKDRISILFCCNAVGFKLRPACVYHLNKPKAFKNILMSSMPVWWKANSIALLTATLFEEWFFSEFTSQVKSYLQKENLPQKAILLIDNEPGHPKLAEKCGPTIQVVFIPPNAVSLLHPFSQGIIATFKRHYISKLIQRMVGTIEKLPDDLSFDILSPSSLEPYLTDLIQGDDVVVVDCNENLKAFWKEYTILKCIYDIIAAWNEITELTVVNSFGKISPSMLPDGFKCIENPADEEVPMGDLMKMLRRLPGCSDASESDLTDLLVERYVELTSEELATLIAHVDSHEDEKREEHSPSNDYQKVLDKIRSAISAIEDEDSDAERSAFMVATLAKIEMEYQNVLMRRNNPATCDTESAPLPTTNGQTENEPSKDREPIFLPYFSDTPLSQLHSSDSEMVDDPDPIIMDLDFI